MSSDVASYNSRNLGKRNIYSPLKQCRPFPYVVGLMTGVILSTLVLFRPDAQYVNNVYVMISVESDQTIKTEKFLSEDIYRIERKSSHPQLLSDEIKIKQLINYVVIRDSIYNKEEVNEQLWELDVAKLNIFVPTGKPGSDGKVEIISKSTTVAYFHSDVQQLSPLVVLWRVCKGVLKQSHWIFFGPSSVYINAHGLESYITQLDSSKPLWLSGLAPDNKTCVWNSGIVFSYSALKLVCPAVSSCITNAVANPNQGDPLVNCVEEAIGYTCATWHPGNVSAQNGNMYKICMYTCIRCILVVFNDVCFCSVCNRVLCYRCMYVSSAREERLCRVSKIKFN